MKSIQVTVAKRDYTVFSLPIKKNRAWRKQFEAPIQDAANLMSEIGSYADKEFEDTGQMIGQIGKAISGTLPTVIDHLVRSADTITQAVFDYSPAMKKDKKRIEEKGYDEEIVSCFLAILSLAFPFGQAIRGLMNLGKEEKGEKDEKDEKDTNGQTEQQTDPNSASQSSE